MNPNAPCLAAHNHLCCFSTTSDIRLRASPPRTDFQISVYILCRQIDSFSVFPIFMTQEKITEPRWPAFLSMMAAGFLYWALPERLSVGPGWFLLAIILILLTVIVISYRRGYVRVMRTLTLIANALLTVALVVSLLLLIHGLPLHLESPKELFRSACVLWVTNILIFALWYWKLDAGGPLARDRARGNLNSSFLFPQMTRPPGSPGAGSPWSPQFTDYLFLAFNTSTAFSPTDTAVLSRWAKVGMMLQALISLLIVALLAGRAVNVF
jgi:hypothetical protein